MDSVGLLVSVVVSVWCPCLCIGSSRCLILVVGSVCSLLRRSSILLSVRVLCRLDSAWVRLCRWWLRCWFGPLSTVVVSVSIVCV